ncbi:transcription termination factor Rho [Leucobacter insecticola]|uniref:Transcription termination factor Rho n=1 Tax=Leucobacter insecticola TaxID=2714934 RepID=A0A6G8FL28_9MICO|nr:transcription termination factor Rho [Leucobacter insecticola]QIM17075.1 transcription termination factor Rho [Leucobacter insecticola]
MSAFFWRRSERKNVEMNTEDTTTPESASDAPEKPVRRRASRRVTAAAGATSDVAEVAAEAAAPAAPAAEEAPKKRATRTRKKAAEPAESAEAPATTEEPEKATKTDGAEASTEPAAPVRRTRGRRAQAATAETASADVADTASAEAGSSDAVKSEAGNAEQSSTPDGASDAAEASEASTSESPRTRSRRGRNQKIEATESADSEQSSDEENKGRGQASQNRTQNQGGQNRGQNNQGLSDRNEDSNGRSSRTRQRDRKRRGQGDDFEPEITEDDVLLPIAGILDVLDNYAFVRTSGYLPGTSDVYVSLGQVKKYSLRRGDAIVGAIRQPRDGEGGSRQKYNAIVKIDSINGRPVDEEEKRADVTELTPVFPQERLRFETEASQLLGRGIDLAAPIGFGQRGLLVLPAQTSAIGLLSELAAAVTANKPEAHLMLVLTNAQPEEVTQLQRTVHGEVIAATFDRAAEDQTTIAELAIDRARRLVELGHDVVVLFDSVNRLARAYAQTQPGIAKANADVIDEYAIAQIKKFLSAARNVENSGSLTILATALTKTGVAADKALLRELRSVINSEVRFVKAGVGQVPTVDLTASHTRNVEAMLGAAEAVVLSQVRRALADEDSASKIAERLKKTSSNAALLAEIQRSGGIS